MENLKVGQKVRIKSKEWYEACKYLGFKLPDDKTIFDVCHIGQIGHIEQVFGNLVLVKFNDGSSNFFKKGWLEPISDGWVSTDEDHKLYIPSDEELKKSVTVNMPNDLDVSTVEHDGKITINIHHKEDKKEEPKFKNGDVIYVEESDGGYISIFQNMWDDVIDMHAVLHLRTGLVYTKEILIRKNIISIRKASRGEQSKLFQVLAKQKKLHWNAEELKFEKYKWRAEHGERYWHITELGTVISSSDYYSPYDNILCELRNYFKTEKLANQALPKWEEFFKNLNL